MEGRKKEGRRKEKKSLKIKILKKLQHLNQNMTVIDIESRKGNTELKLREFENMAVDGYTYQKNPTSTYRSWLRKLDNSRYRKYRDNRNQVLLHQDLKLFIHQFPCLQSTWEFLLPVYSIILLHTGTQSFIIPIIVESALLWVLEPTCRILPPARKNFMVECLPMNNFSLIVTWQSSNSV